MRWMVGAMALVFGATALAQDAGIEVGDTVWVVEEVRSQRFPDAEVTGPTYRAEEPVSVLYVEGDRIRVRRGDRYGWVPVSAVTTDNPATPDAPIEFDLGDFELPDLQLGGE